MAQNIHLNGGPWHDRVVVIEDNRDHLHLLMNQEQKNGLIAVREGTYSQVQGRPGEFEWDGWRSHD